MIYSGMARWTCVAVAVGVAMGGLPAAAQEARDPTVAPRETRSGTATPAGLEGMTVLVRGGKAYLVVGTRLYAPGDKVGGLRVDRITETQVWLRDAKKLIKLQRFAGIERKSLPPLPRCAPVESHQNAPAPATPCEDTQP